MHILYFSRDYTPHDHRFLSALVKAGQRISYLRLEKRGHTLEDRPLPPEVEIIAWAGGEKPFQTDDIPALLVDLERVIKLVKPDLIHAGPLQSAALLAALAGFHPLVSASWGYDLLIDAGSSSWHQWATRFTLKHSDAMVGDCATIRKLAVQYGMPDERIITFPWGVDLQHFSPGPEMESAEGGSGLPQGYPAAAYNGSPSRPFRLLSTRGWEPLYGVDVIAQAFVQAARQKPELQMVMLGNGSQAGLLRQIFVDGNVLDRVLFPGQVRQADLPHYYRSADLYISASHSDGTSISLLEAIACGRPALVSDIPGNREWITPGVEGWWFRDGDASQLAEAILHAVEQRPNLIEMGRAARWLAEQRADWQKNFPQLLKAYQIATHKNILNDSYHPTIFPSQ